MNVSFSIPAYNEELVIADCLQAVVRETKSMQVETEIVVVNNASTDRTKEIALSFTDVRVVDETRKGLVYARAAGHAATTGDIIANIDSDAKISEGWLSKVIQEFERDPNLVALSGPYIYYDLSLYARALAKMFYFPGYLMGTMLQGGNFVIRRSAWDKVGGYDTSIAFYGEDTDVARRLSKIGKVKWRWDLISYTSGRRMKAEGLYRTAWRYALNYFSIRLLKRPATMAYQDVRTSRTGN